MTQWATRQMKRELLTSHAALIMGGMLAVLFFLFLSFIGWSGDARRTHPVSAASQAAQSQEAGWIAEIEYTEGVHLGAVTVETAARGKITFIMGGAMGAAPGLTRTYEDEYHLWALKAESFTALCFSRTADLPESGTLKMDSVIEWLPTDERKALMEEFSDENFPAYVFLLKEDSFPWVEPVLMALLLICSLAIAWLLTAKRALRLTKLFKAMQKAGDPEKIREEMDEPLYARLGFAVSTNYLCVSGSVAAREGTTCLIEKDESGDERLLFRRDTGWTAAYYPDEDELETLRSLLFLKK